MITLDTTKAELKAKWKQMYQTRKKFGPNGVLPSSANYGYFTGKMEYTAWLLLHSKEILDPLPFTDPPNIDPELGW